MNQICEKAIMCKELFFKRSAHTMTQEIEIEFKNIVTEEEFNTHM
ncbi:hypothetical protein ACT7DH_10850 [Bacillus pacificus]